ncbi:MAG: serine/threonine protein kinase [Sumerlaeia bacterium]
MAQNQQNLQDRLKAIFASRNYEILGEIGRGGMGVVYLANDKKLDRKVALKTLSPDRASKENSLRRFEREAKSFARINHPHIATLYEFEDAGPVQYLALEYINGFDLESERKNGRKWKTDEAVPVIISVANALAYTHKKGILHRDIKPGNILIEQGTKRTVLTDFGLAKGKTDESLTATGFAVGTPAYMAPEQISDQFDIEPDGRSDIFALGTVFYEMLTNEHPFIGPDDLKTMRAIVQQAHDPISKFIPDFPEPLSRIIDKMLAKHPDDRFANAEEVEAALKEWQASGKVSIAKAPTGLTPKPTNNSQPNASNPPEAKSNSVASPQASAQPSSNPQINTGMSQQKLIIIGVLFAVAMLLIGLAVGILLKG